MNVYVLLTPCRSRVLKVSMLKGNKNVVVNFFSNKRDFLKKKHDDLTFVIFA